MLVQNVNSAHSARKIIDLPDRYKFLTPLEKSKRADVYFHQGIPLSAGQAME
jgi:hypothetical protein